MNGSSRWLKSQVFWVMPEQVLLSTLPGHPPLSRWIARPAELAVVGDDPALEVPMAHRGRSLAIAVGTGLGGPGAYDDLPASRQPHLQVRGVDELLVILTR